MVDVGVAGWKIREDVDESVLLCWGTPYTGGEGPLLKRRKA